jgi:hypothetical protein
VPVQCLPTVKSAFSGAFLYTWAGQTSDPRALQSSPGSSTDVPAAWTEYVGQSFALNVNVNDSVAHPVSLYLLDWDSATRQEVITIRDASSNVLLSSVTFGSFHTGEYVTLNVRGNVVITVTPIGTTTPVVGGIFFD